MKVEGKEGWEGQGRRRPGEEEARGGGGG